MLTSALLLYATLSASVLFLYEMCENKINADDVNFTVWLAGMNLILHRFPFHSNFLFFGRVPEQVCVYACTRTRVRVCSFYSLSLQRWSMSDRVMSPLRPSVLWNGCWRPWLAPLPPPTLNTIRAPPDTMLLLCGQRARACTSCPTGNTSSLSPTPPLWRLSQASRGLSCGVSDIPLVGPAAYKP